MNEKFNKNAKVEKFTSMLGIAVRLIVIDPLLRGLIVFKDYEIKIFQSYHNLEAGETKSLKV